MSSAFPRTLPALLAVGLIAAAGLLGVSPLSAAEPDAAAEFSQRFAATAPTDAAGFAALGNWAEQHQLPEQAAAAYRRTLEIAPDQPAVYERLMQVAAPLRLPDDPALQKKLKAELGLRFSVHLSPHFLVIYDTDPAWARNRAVLLEATHEAFYHAFRRADLRPLPLQRRLVCVLFRSQNDFLAYAKAVDGVNLDWSSGYYSARTNRIAFFNDDSNHAFAEVDRKIQSLDKTIAELSEQIRLAGKEHNAALAAQYRQQLDAARHQQTWYRNRKAALAVNTNAAKTTHEAAHQLAYNSGIQTPGVLYPFWVVEGLATNFEAAEPSAPFGPFNDNPARRRALKDALNAGRLLPLAELITARPPTEDLVRTNDAYAQSWSLMQFLFRRRQEQLRTYLNTLSRLPRGPRTPQQLKQEFESAFGPAAELEKHWRHAIRR